MVTEQVSESMVDWLRISQWHSSARDVVGEWRLSVDPVTGEVIKRFGTGYQHPGSHDSSVRVRAVAGKVEISGNPSRWNRPDNVWGYTSLQDAAAVWDQVLLSLGLPAFDWDSDEQLRRTQRGESVSVGAKISEVHLARNFALGMPGEGVQPEFFLRWLSSYCWRGKPGQLYREGSVGWYGSKRVVVKWYPKARELRDHGSEDERLIAFLQEHAAVRHEVELKSREVADRGLQRLGAWDRSVMKRMCEIYDWTTRIEIGDYEMSEIESKLVKSGVSPRTARSIEATIERWQAGFPVRQKMSQRTWYRHRNIALRVLGIDITQDMQIDRLPIRCRVIKPRSLAAPAWYRLPDVI